MKLRFGLRVPPCVNPSGTAAFCKRLEDHEWDYAWLPDSQLLWRDVYVTMAASALATSRIRLGTNVTNPSTRHSSVTACAISSVDEMAKGRVILGLGAGDSSVTTIGAGPARIKATREAIVTIRRLISGEQVNFAQAKSRMNIPPTEIPIYLAVVGPKMLRLAGELCDGAITLLGMSEESVRYARYNLEIGAKEEGRAFQEIDAAWGFFCHFTDDPEKGAELVKPYCLSYLHRYPDLFKLNNIRVHGVEPPETVYPDMSHAEDWDKAVQMASKDIDKDTLEQFAEKFCIVGKPNDAIEKLDKLRKLGITNFYIRHLYSYNLPEREETIFREQIIPSLS